MDTLEYAVYSAIIGESLVFQDKNNCSFKIEHVKESDSNKIYILLTDSDIALSADFNAVMETYLEDRKLFNANLNHCFEQVLNRGVHKHGDNALDCTACFEEVIKKMMGQ